LVDFIIVLLVITQRYGTFGVVEDCAAFGAAKGFGALGAAEAWLAVVAAPVLINSV
jgi:hypothetical protein